MAGKRKRPDGLPYNVFMRAGKRITSFRYKHPQSGKVLFKYDAPTVNKEKVAQARMQAIMHGENLNGGQLSGNDVKAWIGQYFAWQESMQPDDERRNADSTLTENKREAKNLTAYFGQMSPMAIRAWHIYEYLDLRAQNGAPAKANKEIALLSSVLEYCRRKGKIEANPIHNIDYNPVKPRTFTVNHAHFAYALREARRRGGSYLVLALGFRTAYLAVTRPEELRRLHLRSITDEGLEIPVGKRKAGQAQKTKIIKWSPRLRLIIRIARKLQRTPSMFIFANTQGQPYTISGWATIWRRLMGYCEKRAKIDGMEFERFALRDMRPTAVTDRMDRDDSKISEATGSSEKIARKVYDRRRKRRAEATK